MIVAALDAAGALSPPQDHHRRRRRFSPQSVDLEIKESYVYLGQFLYVKFL
jgi:hypothetical protein